MGAEICGALMPIHGLKSNTVPLIKSSKMLNVKYLIILALLLCSIGLWAQIPDNDECSGAFVIDNPFNYCTPDPFLDFGFASPSPQPGPSCNVWVPQRDLWFSFTAIAADIAILTTALDVPLGLMVGQQISLYAGTCDNPRASFPVASARAILPCRARSTAILAQASLPSLAP